MTRPALSVDIIDQLSTVRALVACASMACDALDDPVQCDALQTLLTQVEELIGDVARQAEDGLAIPIAAPV